MISCLFVFHVGSGSTAAAVIGRLFKSPLPPGFLCLFDFGPGVAQRDSSVKNGLAPDRFGVGTKIALPFELVAAPDGRA